MTIKGIRALTGLSQKKFAEQYHINLRTLQHWEANPTSQTYRECPEYYTYLLEKVVRQEYNIPNPNGL